ncbi:vacuolar protein sorting-associated protein IST1-like [Aristolochia californica]|uniref:vacuolar protein sorting-associated protein IST1-like n=1 Tax=Aristolochia californica TaxID=171875 RepID=UPI0035D9EEC2
MSLLNSLFNRGILGAKCKTCLNLAISRIKHLRNKRELQLRNMRKEVAQFLLTGQEAIARIRVEHIIREMNILAAYEILELFCELIYARVPILETQRECPPELQEAIASIIFAAPRCLDLPELMQIRNLFGTKYGKEFVLAASELRPDSCVNRGIIEKLSVKAPPVDVKLNLLKDIAQEFDLEWDSSSTESEFNKKHEDLLDGSNQICGPAAELQAPVSQSFFDLSLAKEEHSSKPESQNQGIQRVEVSSTVERTSFGPTTSVGMGHHAANPDAVAQSDRPPNDGNTEKSSQPCDVMERARTAIAAAEKASAAARAAAELVKRTRNHAENRKTSDAQKGENGQISNDGRVI